MNLQEYGKLVQGAVRENYPQIRACYQQALVDAAELAGRVSVFFEVAPDGRIFSARITQASLPDPGTQACYRRVIRSLKLPPPPGGAASIEYPIVLTPD
jgi:TonB family protein